MKKEIINNEITKLRRVVGNEFFSMSERNAAWVCMLTLQWARSPKPVKDITPTMLCVPRLGHNRWLKMELKKKGIRKLIR